MTADDDCVMMEFSCAHFGKISALDAKKGCKRFISGYTHSKDGKSEVYEVDWVKIYRRSIPKAEKLKLNEIERDISG